MPTPFEILLDPISLAFIAMYGALIGWEALFPARNLPVVKGWRLRGMMSFAAYFYLSSYLPLFWDDALSQYQLFDLSGIGTLPGAVIGTFVYEGLLYAWHRAMHESDGLFLSFHQMHHSAERLDTFGAFYFGALDMVGFTLLGSLSLSLVVGISPSAVTVFLLFTGFLGIFQHMNVNTPQWLGYLVQRPESHTVHHGRGLHYFNFSDLPVFDIMFGTFRNPRGHEMETGFYQGASARVAEMLMLQDVSEPKSDVQSQGRPISQSQPV